MKKYLVALLSGTALMFCASSFAQTASNLSNQNQATTSTSQAQSVFAPNSTSYAAGTTYAVSSAIAAPIEVAPGTCAISTSASIQVMKAGVAAAHAYVVDFCARLQKAAALYNMKQYVASMAMLCGDDDDYRYAIAAQGGMSINLPTGETRKVPTGQSASTDTGLRDTKGKSIMAMEPVMKDEPVFKAVRMDCPMSEKEWISAGRPKLDPSTGQPVANTGEHAQTAQVSSIGFAGITISKDGITADNQRVYTVAQTTSSGQTNQDQTVDRATYLKSSVYGHKTPDTVASDASGKESSFEIEHSDGTDDGKLKLVN